MWADKQWQQQQQKNGQQLYNHNGSHDAPLDDIFGPLNYYVWGDDSYYTSQQQAHLQSNGGGSYG
jgi:hypothetical protein